MLSCPECDAVLEVAEAELEEGDSLSCEECGANLVVVATDPAIELEVDDEGDLDDEEEFDEELADEDAELEGGQPALPTSGPMLRGRVDGAVRNDAARAAGILSLWLSEATPRLPAGRTER